MYSNKKEAVFDKYLKGNATKNEIFERLFSSAEKDKNEFNKLCKSKYLGDFLQILILIYVDSILKKMKKEQFCQQVIKLFYLRVYN